MFTDNDFNTKKILHQLFLRYKNRMNTDAWADGQIKSKMWLCRELERLAKPKDPIIYILGGWYGVLAHTLFIREKLKPKFIYSFDIDAEANKMAMLVNNAFTFKPQRFQSMYADCTHVDWFDRDLPKPDIVINTACEHFSDEWLNAVPSHTLLVLQSTNMIHDDHKFNVASVDEMRSRFNVFSKIKFSGELFFDYSPDPSFSRYMLIGTKK